MSQLKFEIQVRTAYEHAWSVATHKLAYKGERVEWRRSRLLALLKAASEQLDHLIVGFDTVAQFISDEYWPEVAAKSAIEKDFHGWFDAGKIPADIAPASWARFAENYYALLRSIGTARYVPDKLLRESLEAVGKYVEDNSGDRFPRSVSLLQTAVGVLAKSGILPRVLRDYHPVISDQLRSLFPEVGSISGSFDFEMIGG